MKALLTNHLRKIVNTSFGAKLLENIVVSYLYAVVLVLSAEGANVLDVGFLQGAALAGIPAALAVVKGFLAKQVGSADSPAFTE
jgi:hypothetical protein